MFLTAGFADLHKVGMIVEYVKLPYVAEGFWKIWTVVPCRGRLNLVWVILEFLVMSGQGIWPRSRTRLKDV